MSFLIHETLEKRIIPVRMMVFDVDGVLTDGSIIYNDEGLETKSFHVQDGHGIRLLQRAGIQVGLITGRYSRVVEHRAEDLGITKVYQNIKIKLDVYEKLLAETGLRDEQIGYAGDDLIDIPVLRRAGFAVAVANAVSHIMPYVHYVTQARGGAGAVREICELLLQTQGLWEDVTRRYFTDPRKS